VAVSAGDEARRRSEVEGATGTTPRESATGAPRCRRREGRGAGAGARVRQRGRAQEG
jgi:hypothetical protein